MKMFLSLFITAIASVSIAFAAGQEDEMLDKIQNANTSFTTLQAHFTQVKTLAATGRQINYDGTLYFTSPDKMSMPYTTPETDCFIINGQQLYMVRDGREGLYDTKKNALMRNLSVTLCACVMGQVRDLAQENDADILLNQEQDGYRVTLIARNKGTRGYSRIILLYGKKNLALKKMELVEFNGTSNIYEMSDIKLNVAVDESVYSIPENKRQPSQQDGDSE